jgi:hypothetical protein
VAIRLGEKALLRLRVECVLERADGGEIPVTDAEREELDRIALSRRPRTIEPFSTASTASSRIELRGRHSVQTSACRMPRDPRRP